MTISFSMDFIMFPILILELPLKYYKKIMLKFNGFVFLFI